VKPEELYIQPRFSKVWFTLRYKQAGNLSTKAFKMYLYVMMPRNSALLSIAFYELELDAFLTIQFFARGRHFNQQDFRPDGMLHQQTGERNS
jgi:hypothetical protein